MVKDSEVQIPKKTPFPFLKFEVLIWSVTYVYFFNDTMAEYMSYNYNYTRCALSFCKNTYKRTSGEDQLSFFRFPEDPVR